MLPNSPYGHKIEAKLRSKRFNNNAMGGSAAMPAPAPGAAAAGGLSQAALPAH